MSKRTIVLACETRQGETVIVAGRGTVLLEGQSVTVASASRATTVVGVLRCYTLEGGLPPGADGTLASERSRPASDARRVPIV